MDIFEEKNITPMLIDGNGAPFDNEDYIYELKLDGIRGLAYLSDTVCELRNKRNKRLNDIYPELMDMNKQIKVKCVLDGEIVLLKNGKPDFYELRRRSLMGNPVKIELAAKQSPVCFIAFDIVYYENKPIVDLPLSERKERLFDVGIETPTLAWSRHIETYGIKYFELAKQQGLEGIVAKRKDSEYRFGKRTKDWIRIKALLDEDFVVCGYVYNKSNTVSLILGAYKDGGLVYQSHVSMGVSRNDYQIISAIERVSKGYYPNFPDFNDAVWIEPKLACTVKYMERTPQGGLRQPVFKGLRDDKTPKECVTG